MSVSFDPSLLDALGEMVIQRCGLRFGADRRADLERGIRAATRELGFSDPAECATSLVSSHPTSAQVRILASHLTIGETYFFREKASFQLLEDRILPHLIQSQRSQSKRIRIWSAGCCSGEEAYSVAICLAKLLPQPQGWDINILGTDINDHFLRKARAGVYGEWSFRDTSADTIAGFFTQSSAGRYHLLPRYQQFVTFSPLNLAEDIFPSALNGTAAVDVILCRNVLIYFDQEQAAKLVRNLSNCLIEGGWLLLGASEGSQVQCEDLVPAAAAGTIAFRKFTGGSRSAETRTAVRTEASKSADVIAAVSNDNVVMAAQARPLQIRTAEPAHVETIASKEKLQYVAPGLLPISPTVLGDAKSLELQVRAYANQGQGSLALDWCEKAIVSDKLNARLHYLRATILQEAGDMQNAVGSFRRAIYLDSDFVMAHIGAGHVARSLGRNKEARQFLRTACRLLGRFAPNQPVPEAEGLDAQHLTELIARDLDKGISQ